MMRRLLTTLALVPLFAFAQTGCEPTSPSTYSQDYVFSEPGRDKLGTPLDHFQHFDEVLVDFNKLLNTAAMPNFQPEYLDTVILNRFNLDLVTPADGDLSFLNRVTFYLQAKDQTRIVLAYCEGFLTGMRSMPCDSSREDLAPYLRQDSYRITTSIEESTRPAKTVLLKVRTDFYTRINDNAYLSDENYALYGP
ncbi:MAG TPA: hypothetical protein VL588_10000 [Bdellovibrionota bacterium]|nr:hypothetical protein [Bdellovibrionota bacterium]